MCDMVMFADKEKEEEDVLFWLPKETDTEKFEYSQIDPAKVVQHSQTDRQSIMYLKMEKSKVIKRDNK